MDNPITFPVNPSPAETSNVPTSPQSLSEDDSQQVEFDDNYPYNLETDDGATFGSDIAAPALSSWPLSASFVDTFFTNDAAAHTPAKSWPSLMPLIPEDPVRSSALLPNWTTDLSNYLLGGGPSEELSTWTPTTTDDSFPDNFTLNDSQAALLATSWWNVFDEQFLRHSLGWSVTLLVAYMVILIMGIIGNCMVILVVVLRPQMRTVTNMFIMNLAVADLFVIVFCVPATLMANVFTPWILGSFMCKGVAYVQGVSVCASAYSLAAISLDRCKAIYRPMERPRGLSKSQALVTICCIWIIALLMTIPWAVIFNVIKSDRDGLSYCVETWKNEYHGKIYFLVANLICCYSLPLVLISLSNIIIWCHVSHRKVPQDSASAGAIKRMHRRTRHGVRKMLGIVTAAFLLSWLPLYVLVTRVKFSKNIGDTEANVLDILMPFAQWLGSWNSSINPVLYAFLNSKFREMFKSLLPNWMPYVHRSNLRNVQSTLGNGTLTNGGPYTGATHTGTGSYSNVYTTRSSMRSSSRLSRHLSRSRSHYNSSAKSNRVTQRSQRALLVSSFRGETPSSLITTGGSLHVPASATISALVCNGPAIQSTNGGFGIIPGNGISTTVTTTTMTNGHAVPSTAIITDL